MLRREFIQISALGVAGVLASQADGRGTPFPKAIAVVRPDPRTSDYGTYSSRAEAISGAVAMLRESRHSYEVTAADADFAPYDALLLADNVLFTKAFKEKIEIYLEQGGAVVASCRSGLAPGGAGFATAAFGIEWKGTAAFSPDFIVTDDTGIGQGMAGSELVMYLKGMTVEPNGATVLARAIPPLPGQSSYPAATRHGRAIYFIHPIFAQYARSNAPWCRRLVLNALDLLVPETKISPPKEVS